MTRKISKKILAVLLSAAMMLTMLPLTAVPALAAVSAGINDMNALDALGINTSVTPSGYDPATADNPYGRNTTTIADVNELFIVGRSPKTSGFGAYNNYAMLYGNNWAVNGSADAFMNTALNAGTPGREKTGTTASGGGSDYVLTDYNKAGGSYGAPNALALAAGNFSAGSNGQKALVGYSSIYMDSFPLSYDAPSNSVSFSGRMEVGCINPANMYKQTYMWQGDVVESGSFILSYDGDQSLFNKDDLKLVSRNVGGTNYTYETFKNDYTASEYTKIATGDFDGDGLDEMAVYVPSRANPRIEIYKMQQLGYWKPVSDGSVSGPVWSLAMTYNLTSYAAGTAVSNNYSNINGISMDLSVNAGDALAPNMVSLAAADFNKDGVDDLAISWGYYGAAMATPPASKAVMLFGAKNGSMLTGRQAIDLAAGSDSVIRASFATGDIDGDGQAELVMGGSLAGSVNIPSRYAAIYKWNGSSFVVTQSNNFVLFEKDTNGNYVNKAVPSAKKLFYSQPYGPANVAVGRFGGLTQPMSIYVDSILISLGDNGMEIASLLDDTLNGNNSISYAEWSAQAADVTGNGTDELFTMRLPMPNAVPPGSVSNYPTFSDYFKAIYNNSNAMSASGTLSYELVAAYAGGSGYTVHRWNDSGKGGMAFCLPNTDNDTMELSYTGQHYYTYSDPKILALLASPPYFKDVYQQGNDEPSATTYGTSSGSGGGTSYSNTISAGIYTSFEKDVQVFGVTVFSYEAELAINNKFTWETVKTSTVEQSVTYETLQGQDTVVFFSIPVETYVYSARVPIIDASGKVTGYNTQNMTVNIPHEASVRTMPLPTYESIAADYDGLPQLSSSALTSTVGMPGSYPTNAAGYGNPGTGFPTIVSSGTPAAIGYGNASSAKDINMSNETENSFNYDLEIDTKLGAGGGGVIAGVTVGYAHGAGSVSISTNGSSYTGKVYDMREPDAQKYGYGFNWRLFVYPYNDGVSKFPVVTYIVTDVTQPPLLPDNFRQSEDGTTQTAVALTWDYTGNAAGFNLYRYFQSAGAAGFYQVAYISAGDMANVTAVNGNTRSYQYIDPNLSPSAEYDYLIQTVGTAQPGLSIPSQPLVTYTKPVGLIPVVALSAAQITAYPDTPASITATLQNAADLTGATLYYQWQKLDAATNTWTNISGLTTNTLLITDAGLADAGQYRCRVSSLQDQTMTSGYSPAVTVTYSKRGVLMQNLSVSGNTASVTVLGASTNLIPSGTVIITLTGTGGTKDYPVALDSSGMATTPAISVDPGVYKVTAAYNGNRVFKTGSADVSDGGAPMFYNSGGGGANTTYWDYPSTVTYGDPLVFTKYTIGSDGGVISSQTLDWTSAINGGKNLFRKQVFNVIADAAVVYDEYSAYIAVTPSAAGSMIASYLDAVRGSVVNRFDSGKAGWAGSYVIPYDINGDGVITNNSARGHHPDLNNRLDVTTPSWGGNDTLDVGGNGTPIIEGFYFIVLPAPLTVDFQSAAQNLSVPSTSVSSQINNLTDNASALRVTGNLKLDDTSQALLSTRPASVGSSFYGYQLTVPDGSVVNAAGLINEGLNIFCTDSRGNSATLYDGMTPNIYTLGIGGVSYIRDGGNYYTYTYNNGNGLVSYTYRLGIAGAYLAQNYNITCGAAALFVTGPAYDVTASASKVNGIPAGTVSLASPAAGLGPQYPTGTQLVFVARPYDGYVVDHWTVNGGAVAGNTANTLQAVQNASGTNVVVYFKLKQNTVTYTANPANPAVNGTAVTNKVVSNDGVSSGNTVAAGADLTFTAAAAAGWHFTGWECYTDGGVTQYGTDATFLLTMPNASVRLFADFARDAYNLTLGDHLVAADGNGNSLDTAKPITGDTAVTVKPAPGYEAAPDAVWTRDGGVIDAVGGVYMFTLLKNTSVSCDNVSAGIYSVTAGVSGSGGSVTVADSGGQTLDPAALSAVTGGTILKFTAAPNRGYALGAWSANSAPVSGQGNVYTCAVSGDLAVLASFTALPSETVTVNTDSHASLSLQADGAALAYPSGGAVTLYQGETLTVTAAPKAGFMVAGWYVNGNYTPSTQKNYTVKYGDGVTSLTPVTQSLTYNKVTYEAVPATGYTNTSPSFTATADGAAFISGASVGGGSDLAFAFIGTNESVTSWTVTDNNGARTILNGYGYPLVGNSLTLDGMNGNTDVKAEYGADSFAVINDVNGVGLTVDPSGQILTGSIVTVTVPAPGIGETLSSVTAGYGAAPYAAADKTIQIGDVTFTGFDAATQNSDGSFACVIGGIPGDVDVSADYESPTSAYPVTFQTNGVTANGVTATGIVSPTGNLTANTTVTVTVALTGTAAADGTQTIGLSSSALGSGVIMPPVYTKTVTADQNMTASDIFTFTFTMPAADVTDLTVANTYSAVPTYLISASTLTNFGSLEAGYTPPTAQTVTITNTGTGSVTLTQPTATNYYIGALSTTTLAAGGTATFTVQPKAGLAVGNHDETITVSGSNGASATVNASFTVAAATTYSVSASTLTNFGSLEAGYKPPTSQTVTVTNTGTGSVTLTQPTATNYDIGAFSATTLAAGGTATFTVQPKAGLAVGNHDETITINGDNSTSATVAASFTVTDTTLPAGSITIAGNSWNSFWNTVTFGLFCKDTQTATVTASDNSGTVTIQYYLSPCELDSPALDGITAWTAYPSSDISLNPNNKYIVYVKLTDPSNNTAYINSTGIVLYTDSAAAASAMFSKASAADLPVSIAMNGNTVNAVTNGGATLTVADYTVGTDTITFSNVYLQTLADGTATFSITWNPLGETYPALPLPGGAAPATSTITLTVSAAPPATYAATVSSAGTGATGSGTYAAGDTVSISAGTAPAGTQFANWTSSPAVIFANANSAATSFTMPASEVTVTANFTAILAAVTDVTLNTTSVTVQTGATYQFSATVNGTNNPDQSVTWAVTGGIAGTSISTGGLLTIASGETAATLTVTAKSVADPSKSGSAIVTVSATPPPAATVTSVEVIPTAFTMNPGDSYTFGAVVNGTNNPSQGVTWAVAGGVAGTSISTGGVLTVAANETAATLTVRATSTLDTTKSGAASVTVTKPAPAFVAVTGITGVPATATAGTPLTLSGTVNPAGATNKAITWSVSPNNTLAGVGVSGNTLTAATAGTAIVRATVANGATASTDYAQDFNITVSQASVTTYTITASAGTGGSISPSGSVTVNRGANQTFTIAANSGYYIASVMVDGVNQAAVSAYTFANVTGDHTITASFAYNGGGSSGGGGYTPPYVPPATPAPTVPTPTAPPTMGSGTTVGNNTVTTPTGQSPVKNPDGTTTLPGGGTITTQGGTTIAVPAGTVLDKNGNIIKLPNGSAGGSITQGSNTTTVDPGMTITITDGQTSLGGFTVTWQNPFKDVYQGDWFYDQAEYMYTHGLMAGTGNNGFSPNMNLTRGMIVTILYRAAGSPSVSGLTNPFSDVSSGQYYTDPVEWAVVNGIVSGIGGGKYDPNAPITRQDLTVILYRYAQYAGMQLPVTRNYTSFMDDADIANYAKDAIEAFFKAGIISGYPDGSFQPQGEATRAEVSAMLQKFLELIK